MGRGWGPEREVGEVVEIIHVMHQSQRSGGSQDALNKSDAIISSVTF